MEITMQEEISEALDNLKMATTEEKFILSQMTITMKQMSDTNNILTYQLNTLT